MSITRTEELARTFETELGGKPVAKRTWAVTLSNDTLANNPPTESELWTALSLDNWAAAHPTMSWLGLRKLSILERFQDSPYHVQVVGEYGVVSANELLSPTSRTAEWSFESQPSQVPALYYWDGTIRKPLTNSAGDYFEGLTTDEQMVRATMRKNYASFPKTQMAATNSINSGEYFGCPAHTWKVAGVNSVWTIEPYNNTVFNYWATTCELMYRQSGWNLQLPDVGWNYLADGQKRRAMVFDYENAEWVASANPVALDGNGNQSAMPAILERRVSNEANFLSLFGTPPNFS